jgi:hypothetical protein
MRDSVPSMSALGPERTSPAHLTMSALPPKADIIWVYSRRQLFAKCRHCGLATSRGSFEQQGSPSQLRNVEKRAQRGLLLDHFVASQKIAASSALLMHRMPHQ